MATSAECDEIFFGIIAGMAAKFLVMNLKVRATSTTLASPTVAA